MYIRGGPFQNCNLARVYCTIPPDPNFSPTVHVQVELLLVDMILDKRVFGKIDQINGFLLLGGESDNVVEKKYDALEKWTDTLSSLNKNLGARVTL